MQDEIKLKIINFVNKRYKYYVVILLFFTFLGYAGEYFYFFDILSHLRVLLLIFSVIFLIIFPFINKFKKQAIWVSIIVFIPLIINFIEVSPWISFEKHKYSTSQKGIKIALSNVLTSNNNYKAVIDFIDKNKPDIIVLQEVNNKWLKELKELKKKYPYGIAESREDNFGIALYSRIPVTKIEIVYWGEYYTPSILFETYIDNKKVRMLAIHTTPPTNQDYFKNRNSQFLNISNWFIDTDHIWQIFSQETTFTN